MWLPPTGFSDHRHWVRIPGRTVRAPTLGKTAWIDAQPWESTKGTLWPCVTQHPVKSMTHASAVRTDQGSLGCSPHPHTATLEHRILNGASLSALLSRLLGSSPLPIHFQILGATEGLVLWYYITLTSA